MPIYHLSQEELALLRRPVVGKGGFQSLLRGIQDKIDVEGMRVELSPAENEKMVRYAMQYGPGGFQERMVPTARSAGADREDD